MVSFRDQQNKENSSDCKKQSRILERKLHREVSDLRRKEVETADSEAARDFVRIRRMEISKNKIGIQIKNKMLME